jgi:hypothetical protein
MRLRIQWRRLQPVGVGRGTIFVTATKTRRLKPAPLEPVNPAPKSVLH